MSSSMSSGSQTTGTSNDTYDLVSVLYHLLEGAQTYGKYIQDAQQSGDQDLVQFFQQAQSQDKQRADQAKQILGRKLGGMQGSSSQSQSQNQSAQSSSTQG